MKRISLVLLLCLVLILTTGVVMGTESESQEVAEPFNEDISNIDKIPSIINSGLPTDSIPDEFFFSGEVVDETEFENELSEVIKTDDNNIMLFDQELNITGEAKDLILAAGGKIVSKALGSYAFLAANELNVSGEIFKDTFVGGNEVNITGNIGRDLYTLGKTINISGTVTRDVYVGGEALNITGNVGGNIRFAGGSIFISPSAVINGNIYLTTSEIEIRDGATINGIVEYCSDAEEVIIPSNIKTTIKEVEKVEAPAKNEFLEIVESFLWWTVANGFLFLIAISIFPNLFENIKEVYETDSVQKYCSSAGWGILCLIVIPIVSVFALFTFIGSTLGVMGLLLYVIGYMIATVIVGYALAETILEKTKNKYIKGLLGILIIEVLRRLPVIGWLVVLLVNSIAFGTVLKLIKQSNKKQENVIEGEKTEE